MLYACAIAYAKFFIFIRKYRIGDVMKVKATVGIAKILKEEGVEWISVFPSSGMNTPCGDEGITNLMMREERFAIAVADGFSRVSNGKRFGVCSVQSGLNSCGVQYGYGALAQAYEDSTPLLCITDGISPSITGVKSFDVGEAFKSVTKWTGYLNKPHRTSEFMTRAFTYLRTGKPGPVLLRVPQDLGEYNLSDFPYTPPSSWKQQANPKDIQIAVRSLLSAENPLIYAGQGIFYADASEELLNFAELIHAPVLTTLKGKSCFPENHPLSIGVKGLPAEEFLRSSDLVFAVGSSLLPGRRYGGFAHHIPDSKRSDLIPAMATKKIIQCTNDPMDVNRYYQVDHAVLGDVKLVLNQLMDEINKQNRPLKNREKIEEEIEKAKKAHLDKYLPLMTSSERPINPFRVYGEIMNAIDRKNSFVTHDSGNTREQLATVFESQIPHGFLGWGNVSTLGFGLGAAIGAKLAYPERETINVAGDAAIGYQLCAYEALVRNGIGVTTVHINNDGFAGYGPGFWGKGSNPYVADITPSTILNMSKVLEGLGEYSERVEDPDEISPALKRALKQNASGKPAYLEIICSKYPVAGAWLKE